MADDRYSWLDEDAAERLLRGEPADAAVGAGDGAARARAERLAAALADAADTRPPGPGAGLTEAELPGEEGALAAFRKVREARADASCPESTRGEAIAHPEAPPTVRIGRPRASRACRPFRIGRPLRAGLAVALAGCALGGFAIAGVLPTPFGGGEPLPAESVSVGATGPDSAPPSTTEDRDLPPLGPEAGASAGDRQSGAGGREPGDRTSSPDGRGQSSGNSTARGDDSAVPGQGGKDRNKA
ncbi:hypothetical protein ACTWQE_07710, partial [Streptomyces sp. 8N706]